MTDRQRKTLELFSEYLNQFNTELPDEHKYTPHNWEGEHSTIETIAQYETGHYYCEVYMISDGDEGGPNVLTMYFDTMIFSPEPNHLIPRWGTQEFDTEIYLWLNEGELRTP